MEDFFPFAEFAFTNSEGSHVGIFIYITYEFGRQDNRKLYVHGESPYQNDVKLCNCCMAARA